MSRRVLALLALAAVLAGCTASAAPEQLVLPLPTTCPPGCGCAPDIRICTVADASMADLPVRAADHAMSLPAVVPEPDAAELTTARGEGGVGGAGSSMTSGLGAGGSGG